MCEDCPWILDYLCYHDAAPTLTVLALNCRRNNLCCLPCNLHRHVIYYPCVKYVERSTAMVTLVQGGECTLKSVTALVRWEEVSLLVIWHHHCPMPDYVSTIIGSSLVAAPLSWCGSGVLLLRRVRLFRYRHTTILVRTRGPPPSREKGWSKRVIVFFNDREQSRTVHCLRLAPVGRGADGLLSLSSTGVPPWIHTKDVSSSHSFFHHVSSFPPLPIPLRLMSAS